MIDALAIWWLLATSMAVLAALLIPLPFLDRRRLDGGNVWAKPIKFSISLAIHFLTLALVTAALAPAVSGSLPLTIVASAAAAATLYEMAYIVFRAARGERSHFNVATRLAAALYAGMAFGAVVITLAAGAVGLAVVVGGAPALGPATWMGTVIGLVGGTVLTFLTAFPIGAALSRHVGKPPADEMRMPLTGWSLSVADRRIPHFLGTHAMQALPLAGLVLDLLLPAAAAGAAILVASALYVLVVLASARLVARGVALPDWGRALLGHPPRRASVAEGQTIP
ncbi:hypothetical protein OSH08_08620 [Kaistia geumhonensis]|uniref:DUF4013 domain-containing protein n=1 Tax=Kaistia geumhonensis TaxID=410839 RepID=A0ABU0M434_9HYPH|nr:hypothetical protein [Kaistia geumhonensis]MCX5479066.1 hypothetical protein [Kaistia geumhonensis]MDQ0515714.1 hypothetical protein [Kaistia geumhonensis]